MIKMLVLLAGILFSYQVRSGTFGLLKDSLTVRAFGGQATPYSASALTGALFPFDPSATPFPSYWLIEAPGTGSTLFFSLVFPDSIAKNIASAEYRFYPAGSFLDSCLRFSRLDSLFYGSLDNSVIPNGACGQVRVIDNNGNFFALDYRRLPSAAHSWAFNPNRWYAIKPSRNSRKLLDALCNRPNLAQDMGQKYLYCYYKNGAFHDYSSTDDFRNLKLTDAFLVYLTESFTFQDTLESVLLDSTYVKPIHHLLNAGWNLIVNPYHYPVCVSNILAPGKISPFFSFSDSSNARVTYYNVHSPMLDSNDALLPFEGYWVLSDADNPLVFYPYTAPCPGLAKPLSDSSWFLSVKNSRSSILLGKRPEPMVVPLPPTGRGNALCSDKELAVDIRPLRDQGFVAKLGLDKGLAHDFRLSRCRDERSVIYVADSKTAFPLENDSTCRLKDADYFEVYFLSGSACFVESKISEIRTSFPEAFTISGNYPNPCNPTTAIQYGVPFNLKGQELSFAVYDIRGRTIFSRSIQAMPGFHTLEWDLKDNRGKPVSSGCFIGKLRINNDYKTIKMAVIK